MNQKHMGGTSIGKLLIFTILIFCMAGVSVFAYDDGDRVRYTSYEDSYGAVIFTVDGNRGFCCETGVVQADSGTATVDTVPSTSRVTKTLAYISKNGWDERGGYDGTSGLPWSLVCQAMSQYAVEGDAAVEFWKSGTGGRWPDETCNTIIRYVNTAQSVAMPKGFKVFIANAGSYQNAAVFYIAPPGYVALQKSADKQPQNNKGASIAGAVYYVYTDASCTTRAKDSSDNNIVLTTAANGLSNTVEIDEGTYYAKEITASPGFNLDTTVRQVTVTSNNTASNPAKFSSIEPLKTGYAKVKKVSKDTSITG